MIINFEMIAGVEVDLNNPVLKEGYDARIAAGEKPEEILEGLKEMFLEEFAYTMKQEFSEQGVTITTEVK